jgi:predicted transcriptional regulator of viral defense system
MRYASVMPAPATAFERLLPLAGEQHGFVRTSDARTAGVDPTTLRKLAAEGRLEHRGWGLYRLATMPITANDEYHEAVLWLKQPGVIAGEAALALWDLADVNPRRIEVIVPPAYNPRRLQTQRYAYVRRALAPGDVDEVDNIPVLNPRVAIRDAIKAGVAGHLVEQAIAAARRRELLDPLTEARLRVELADRVDRKPRPRRHAAEGGTQ